MYPRIPFIPAHHRFTHFGEDYLLLHVLLTIRLGGAGDKNGLILTAVSKAPFNIPNRKREPLSGQIGLYLLLAQVSFRGNRRPKPKRHPYETQLVQP